MLKLNIMNLQKACVILTTGVVCAVVVYYTWSMYTELNSLKYRLRMIELQSSKQLEMEIDEDEEEHEHEPEYINFGEQNNTIEDEAEQEEEQEEIQLENAYENENKINHVQELFQNVDADDEEEADEEAASEEGEVEDESEYEEGEVEDESVEEEGEENESEDEDEDEDEHEEEKRRKLIHKISDQMSKNTLIRLSKENNLSVYGNKDVLISRLLTLNNYEVVLNL